MKTRLKLKRREMDLLIAFIEATYPTGKLSHYGKLIAACLSQLLHKLSVANVIIKDEYQLTIDASSGLGFLLHCTRINHETTDSETAITVNKVIGLVDQKAGGSETPKSTLISNYIQFKN